AVGTAEPGQNADDDAEHDAHHHQQQVERLHHDREAVKKIADILNHAFCRLLSLPRSLHQYPNECSSGPFGSGTRNQISNMKNVSAMTAIGTTMTKSQL